MERTKKEKETLLVETKQASDDDFGRLIDNGYSLEEIAEHDEELYRMVGLLVPGSPEWTAEYEEEQKLNKEARRKEREEPATACLNFNETPNEICERLDAEIASDKWQKERTRYVDMMWPLRKENIEDVGGKLQEECSWECWLLDGYIHYQFNKTSSKCIYVFDNSGVEKSGWDGKSNCGSIKFDIGDWVLFINPAKTNPAHVSICIYHIFSLDVKYTDKLIRGRKKYYHPVQARTFYRNKFGWCSELGELTNMSSIIKKKINDIYNKLWHESCDRGIKRFED